MVKEIEGKFTVGDTSLYTKTWLVSDTFLPLFNPIIPSSHLFHPCRCPTAVTLPPARLTRSVSHTTTTP